MAKRFSAILLLWIFCLPSYARGFSYDYFSDGYFTSYHVLTVDPKVHSILPVRAEGRESVTAIAKSSKAAAAINGGFFKKNGNPAGILKINDRWYGTPDKPRGAIGWSKNGQHVLIDRVLTQTSPGGEIEVIPLMTSARAWRDLEYIVGGTPVLVKGGSVVEDYSPELTLQSFLTRKYPRTAIGIKETGEWVFVVVDGSWWGILGGMAMKELAELMRHLGCIDALNLDGGGSTTMVIGGEVVNEPCGSVYEDGKWVEAVSDAIVILPADPVL